MYFDICGFEMIDFVIFCEAFDPKNEKIPRSMKLFDFRNFLDRNKAP